MANPIDLSRVNISLQQFQDISRGEYNAGEVKLAGESKLAKMNNHVHRIGKNTETISHAEVIAVKEAFIKALTQNGVASEELSRIRKDLGLAADGAVDHHPDNGRGVTFRRVRRPRPTFSPRCS